MGTVHCSHMSYLAQCIQIFVFSTSNGIKMTEDMVYTLLGTSSKSGAPFRLESTFPLDPRFLIGTIWLELFRCYKIPVKKGYSQAHVVFARPQGCWQLSRGAGVWFSPCRTQRLLDLLTLQLEVWTFRCLRSFLPLLPLPLATTNLFSVSMSLGLWGLLDSTHKWDHTVIVLLCLSYHT